MRLWLVCCAVAAAAGDGAAAVVAGVAAGLLLAVAGFYVGLRSLPLFLSLNSVGVWLSLCV